MNCHFTPSILSASQQTNYISGGPGKIQPEFSKSPHEDAPLTETKHLRFKEDEEGI